MRDGTTLSTTLRPPNRFAEPGKDLQRRHPAGQRARELRILRPDGMLGPDVGGDRVGRLVAVGVRIDAGRGIDADVRMHVDDPRRHVLAVPSMTTASAGASTDAPTATILPSRMRIDASCMDRRPAAVSIVAWRTTVVREVNGVYVLGNGLALGTDSMPGPGRMAVVSAWLVSCVRRSEGPLALVRWRGALRACTPCRRQDNGQCHRAASGD